MGEVLRVDAQQHFLDINNDSWIYVAPGSDPSPEKQAPTASLKPDQGGSGSVITGDGNIAHTKWKVGYERRDSSNYARHVIPGEEEEMMVFAAVKRGVVQAAAQVTVDDLLRQNVVHGTTVPQIAWRVAQETLDRLGSGLTITSLTMDPPIPPLAVRTAFGHSDLSIQIRDLLCELIGVAAQGLHAVIDI
jgi:hypothetical protein